MPVLTSAFHIEADVRAEIAACLKLILSRPSGDGVYQHVVYGKPVVSVWAAGGCLAFPDGVAVAEARALSFSNR